MLFADLTGFLGLSDGSFFGAVGDGLLRLGDLLAQAAPPPDPEWKSYQYDTGISDMFLKVLHQVQFWIADAGRFCFSLFFFYSGGKAMWEVFHGREEWVGSFIKCLVGFALGVVFFLSDGMNEHVWSDKHDDVTIGVTAARSGKMWNWLGGVGHIVLVGSICLGIVCVVIGGVKLAQKASKGEAIHNYVVLCFIGLAIAMVPYGSTVYDINGVSEGKQFLGIGGGTMDKLWKDPEKAGSGVKFVPREEKDESTEDKGS